MFDTQRRNFVRRKNFHQYGSEDRSRYTYQGDLFNQFSKNNNEDLFKYIFENDSIPNILYEQNFKAAGDLASKISEDINSVYQFLFEESLPNHIKAGLSGSFGVQVKQLKSLSDDNYSILEMGPGSALLAPLYFKNSTETAITYIILEAIPQHLVIQQLVLKYFSAIHNTYTYCSSIKKYKELQQAGVGNIVLHIGAWDLPKIDLSIDLIVANNFFDQISQRDFDEYTSEIKNRSKPSTKLSLWGGIEKGGVSNLYLFGYGTYHNYNVIEKLSQNYSLESLGKEGSEFHAIFNSSGSLNVEENNVSFDVIEEKLISNALDKTSFLWVDDNATFLNQYSKLFENIELISATSSVNTAPLPCKIQREHIDNQTLNDGNQILIISYRWNGVVNYFLEKEWRVSIEKISDRVVIATLKNDFT